ECLARYSRSVAVLTDVAVYTEILRRRRSLADNEVQEKKPGVLVTLADTEPEAIITTELHSAFPDAVVLGEEASATDPDLIERFYRVEQCFSVDLVDVTALFV